MPESSTPILFFNRYSGRMEAEAVYGEPFLRWVYESRLGRFSLHLLIKRAFFSKWYGWRMASGRSRAKIGPFIARYGIPVDEMEIAPDDYPDFNAFFSRRLKPGARPIDPDADHVVFPADGRHLGFQDIASIEGVFVKGQHFNLDLLLNDAELAKAYRHGSLVLSRLCPVDYHRFHFPAAGLPGRAECVNGFLFSVNPIALRRNLAYLWTNRRVLTRLDTRNFGTVLIIEIGATCVGSIHQSYEPGRPVRKGQEKGWFEFGGSSVVTLFEGGRVRLSEDLLTHSRAHCEVYARMGDTLGEAR